MEFDLTAESRPEEGEFGGEEKMERFFELVRDMRDARIRMARLREREEGECPAATAMAWQSKRRKDDRYCRGKGEGSPWVPKFEAEDFGVNVAESGKAALRANPRTLGKVGGVKEKLDEGGSGLNLTLSL